MNVKIHSARVFLERYERLLNGLMLLGGFAFDAYFFRRIDLPFENLWIVLHFIVGFLAIIMLHLATARYGEHDWSKKVSAVLPLVLQFAIGGLFGKFFVFFFTSGSLANSWPVLAFLLFLTIVNESSRHRYAQLNFNVAVFYTALLVYCIVIAPIALESISTTSFLVGGFVSLGVIALVIKLINFLSYDINRQEQWYLVGAITFVYILFNALYFLNFLPPIPLALRDAGVYHLVTRTAPGVYEGLEEKNRSWIPFTQDAFHRTGNEPIYVFTAIFAPAHFATTVVHRWQWKNEKGTWVVQQKVSLSITGGRDGGYRGYSLRSGSVPAGDWRVDVETTAGQRLGRIDFTVEQVTTSPALQTVSL